MTTSVPYPVTDAIAALESTLVYARIGQHAAIDAELGKAVVLELAKVILARMAIYRWPVALVLLRLIRAMR